MSDKSATMSFCPLSLTVPYCPTAAAIHQTGFDFPWTQEAFESLLLLPSTVAWIDETGLLVCSQVCDEMEILTICILPEFRGQGKGFKWLSFLFDYARQQQINRIFLEVSVENKPARHLYHKAGFTQIGCRKNYYKTQTGFCDALCMEKKL